MKKLVNNLVTSFLVPCTISNEGPQLMSMGAKFWVNLDVKEAEF